MVVIHYEEALYQEYAPLPLLLLWMMSGVRKVTCSHCTITNNNTRLTAIFQDSQGKLVLECHHSGFYWSKDDGDDGDSCSYKTCKAPVKLSPPTNQHETFYRLDALPVTQPTLLEHGSEKVSIPRTCLPLVHLGVFQPCF